MACLLNSPRMIVGINPNSFDADLVAVGIPLVDVSSGSRGNRVGIGGWVSGWKHVRCR